MSTTCSACATKYTDPPIRVANQICARPRGKGRRRTRQTASTISVDTTAAMAAGQRIGGMTSRQDLMIQTWLYDVVHGA